MRPRTLLITGIVMEGAYLLLPSLLTGPDGVLTFIAVQAAVFTLLAVLLVLLHRAEKGSAGAGVPGPDGPAQKGAPTALLIIGFGILFRLTCLPHHPVASDDIYRYLWDGRVAAHGINPYAYAPNDPALASLATAELPGRVNNPALRTPYPPLAELFFLASSRAVGDAPVGLKAFLVLADCCTLFVLLALLRLLKRDIRWLLVYAWSPLPVMYFALDGHIDALGILLLVLFLLLWLRHNEVLSAVALALAALAKLYPLFVVPLLVRSATGLRRLTLPLLAIVLVAAGYLAWRGPTGGVLDGVLTFSQHWYFNSPLFMLILPLVSYNNGPAHLVCGVLFLGWMTWLSLSRRPMLEKVFLTFLGFILLSPVVHPWYLTWLGVLLVVRWSTPVFALTGLSGLSNIVVWRYQTTGIWRDDPVVLLLEYVPVLLIALWGTRSWFRSGGPSRLARRLSAVALLLVCMVAGLPAQQLSPIESDSLRLMVTAEGALAGIMHKEGRWKLHLRGATVLEGCTERGPALRRELPGGGVSVTRTLVAGKEGCTLTDSFIPDGASIRWEVTVEGTGGPWSAPLSTVMQFPDTAGAEFWTTWGDPDHRSPADWGADPGRWHDPFARRPFMRKHLVYGGHFGKGAGYSIPGFSVFYPATGLGISLMMSPDDPLLDLQLVTASDGSVVQTRRFHRIQKGRALTFTMHLMTHDLDWRSVMAWMVDRYPGYFRPVAAHAGSVSGLGAYSSYEGPIDTVKYAQMGGIVNWKASFDFPYMGMFIAPVNGDTVQWRRFDVDSNGKLVPGRASYTSIDRMRRYARRMKQLGFATLNYFNLTEFGGVSDFADTVVWPPPRLSPASSGWTNPSAFLYRHFPNAILFGALKEKQAWNMVPPAELMLPPVNFHATPFWTWGGAIAVDVGDSAYARFMLEQARLHVEKIPDAQGICIDRFDWFNEYNWHADDGRSWVGGRPVRSLLNSYKGFIPRLGKVMHEAGKVVFCNPHMNRLELMQQIDGIYNEFGHIGHNMNQSAFLAFFKPLLCWTPDSATVMKDPDGYFQRHLVMGAFPTAPFPGNDHTIGPDPVVERWYADYGPLFRRLRGREWVLIPGVIEVPDGAALANIFTSGNTVIVPVVMGTRDTVVVRLRHCSQLVGSARVVIEVWYPGGEAPVKTNGMIEGDELHLRLPLRRGCAFVVLAARP